MSWKEVKTEMRLIHFITWTLQLIFMAIFTPLGYLWALTWMGFKTGTDIHYAHLRTIRNDFKKLMD